MEYVKAQMILPEDLVKEIQKYVQGQYIYVPSQNNKKKRWGENTGTRNYIINRNEEIKTKYLSGNTIDMLADEYFLSIHSIKKIIYTKSSCL